MRLIKDIPLIKCLLLATFFNGLVFMILIPIWHGPDEQAHFAQVQHWAEFKRDIARRYDRHTTSQEILTSEQLLGTERDQLGKNQFTHKPWYRIEYTNTTIGKYEQIINKLPRSSRKNLVKQESTLYPPLFYALSSIFYLLVYPQSLIIRVFAARLFSILLRLVTVYLIYKIGTLLFPKQPSYKYTLALLASFQPMLSFTFASVNSDNLMNLLYTAFIYLSLIFIKQKKLILKNVIAMGLVIYLGMLTKPHFAIALITLIALPIFNFKNLIYQYKKQKPLFLSLIILVILLICIRFKQIFISLISGAQISFSDISFRFIKNPNHNISLVKHFIWTIRHTIAEVIPWYWGVFNWLGVTLPRTVNRIINRVMILSAVGLVIWSFKNRHLNKWKFFQKALLFLIFSSVIFFIVLFFWDWLFIRQRGYSFGMQGRYYFPTISAHMALLLTGLLSLVPDKLSLLKKYWEKIIGLSSILLNFIGLYTLANAYYNLSPVNTFLIQVSQYKPTVFKYPWTIIWFALYAISIIVLISKYLSYESNSTSRH